MPDLPLFNALTKETLRRWPTLPGRALSPTSDRADESVLERVVGPGGDVFAGFVLPAGTEVGIQPYTIHRDESIFVRCWHSDWR